MLEASIAPDELQSCVSCAAAMWTIGAYVLTDSWSKIESAQL